MKYIKPANLLAIYAAVNVLLSFAAMFVHGMPAVYIVIAIAFFMSIMFPTIFSLGIKELDADTEMGSSLIVMSIVGGAIMPPVLALISDITGDIQLGYFVPLICFGIVFYFSWKGYRVLPIK
jgi:FHS family L-fucose permease-like MFS transporter